MIKAFCSSAGISVETVDISLAARILAQFPELLTSQQKTSDGLAELGEAVKKADANIIKLPNISASLSQLKEAISELQSKGFKVPVYPEIPKTEEEKAIHTKYSKVLGSAVNPVIREGNSDRRVAPPVKEYAKKNPHKLGAWDKNSKSHIANMTDGDFYGSEKSYISTKNQNIKIQLVAADGTITELKKNFPIKKDEIIDASFLSCKKLTDYFESEINKAKADNILLSLHLKATMMKVSDPIIFGHAVKVFFKDVFTKYESTFKELGVNANNGLADLYQKISALPVNLKNEIESAIMDVYKNRPTIAMVNADKGITNLHVPSDIIIDASLPAALKSSGKMWGPDNKLHDTKALVPDRCYAGIYQVVIDFLKKNGAFDVTKMGSVANVGLMALKAEEYGSHDKTFEIKNSGKAQVVSEDGTVIFEHSVEKGDIWRMCQTQNIAVTDWVKLAVLRSKASQTPAIFWLDSNRAHDRNLINLVNESLKQIDTKGAEIQILDPMDAMAITLERVKKGEDTISVTGNVLRDYLTDLFPILELGTSAKMLSIVPLLAGGGLYETGAGGSAPKHVEQLIEENHLRWDSLGEFLAIAVSIEDYGVKSGNKKIKILAEALNAANGKILLLDKSPSRDVGEIDNRGSHFYLSLYWAEALALQTEDTELQNIFKPIYEKLFSNENKILNELNSVQGKKVDIGGYYWPEEAKLNAVMRPSKTLNEVIDNLYKLNPI
jgi:isocitrate dehydrogenase